MSETSNQPKPESQTIRGCSELREKCQKTIFEKMDDLHNTQMQAISEIGNKIAFMEGKAAGSNPSDNGFKDVLIRFIIAWGPWVMMILGLGLISLLKSKNIL